MNRFLKWALTNYGNLLKNPPHIPVFLTNLSVPVLENLLGICGMIRIHGAYEFRGRKRNGEVSRNHEFPKLSPASFEDSRTESVVTIVWSSLRYSTLLRFFDVFFVPPLMAALSITLPTHVPLTKLCTVPTQCQPNLLRPQLRHKTRKPQRFCWISAGAKNQGALWS